MPLKPIERMAIIGFGEAGGILGQDIAAAGVAVTTYDKLFKSPAAREAMISKALAAGAQPRESAADAAKDAEVILSAVTASSAPDVARELAAVLRPGQIFLDMNSVSPKTKQHEAAIIEKSGADFVESAVMAPVPPQRIKVPMLLGGKAAADLAPRMKAIGMNATAVSDRIGVASAIKMCRSVVVKGLEALVTESLLAARRYGAEEAMLASLAATFPQMKWQHELPEYLISRVAEHGKRRAEEMREVAAALRDVGVDPLMALATAQRQDWLVNEMAARKIPYRSGEAFSWRALFDQMGDQIDAQVLDQAGKKAGD
jgi:3-hydroxyisobutyrate dehydrogenase-like beta-hydroxyacid dehydrogenase